MKKYITGEEPKVGDKVRYVKEVCDSEELLEIGEIYKVGEISPENDEHDGCSDEGSVYFEDEDWWAHIRCFELVKRGPKFKGRVIRD
jgi:hypothetical protein